ncbi:cytochrome c [Roseateles depolymerans]|uniref:Membrane-bound D-gluconate 2-dehydrogenase cytochrome c subunit n=1 Tax=Roseateles depolymerans TaxID=76731 RepID=A0A0U3L848_9BURK|nr:cytochrome c [Roseateles depolymerans]ALV07486.1 Membrane-bound D-gluconate 2-dehydrogenase cytochrome c subunit [Roseateles depolymerans]REG22298.1 mono/diheme cytochrome c family protein [Roseateles depolymerans]
MTLLKPSRRLQQMLAGVSLAAVAVYATHGMADTAGEPTKAGSGAASAATSADAANAASAASGPASATAPAPAGAAAESASGSAKAALIARGQYLARAGDCIACHSAPGQPAFAGGLPIDSGHGIIYSTNITPDPEHGIGRYTPQQFADAVRKGQRADGTHLYPAMPYTSYVKVTDEDMQALYTYFMEGVKPVAKASPTTSLSFPFNLRFGMGLWNWFFAPADPFKPVASWTPQVSRGAYLVEGLGHCGSCHTPRGVAMNEKASHSGEPKFLSGGELNDWAVPSLRGLPRWSEQDIVDYLQTGRNPSAAVAGEMTEVVRHSTAYLQEDDLHAMAVYLKGLTPVADRASQVKPQGAQETAAKLTQAVNLSLGERLYLDNCAACHFVDGKGAQRVFPSLDGATVINADNPSALIHVMLKGARTPSTEKAPSVLVMPGFDHRLSDSEVATLATFLRQGWTNRAAPVSEKDVAKVRARLQAH